MPVLGFSLDGLVGVGGELSPTGLDLVGDMEGNPTLACGGALEAVEVERAVACGWRSPCEGTWRRLGALERLALADGVQVDGVDIDESLEGVRRLPCAWGNRRGRGTLGLRGVKAGDDLLDVLRQTTSRRGVRSEMSNESSFTEAVFEDVEPPLGLLWMGDSAGVTGVTRLAVEDDVDGLVKPISAPSWMYPSNFESRLCRLGVHAEAERSEDVDVRDIVLDITDAEDPLD